MNNIYNRGMTILVVKANPEETYGRIVGHLDKVLEKKGFLVCWWLGAHERVLYRLLIL